MHAPSKAAGLLHRRVCNEGPDPPTRSGTGRNPGDVEGTPRGRGILRSTVCGAAWGLDKSGLARSPSNLDRQPAASSLGRKFLQLFAPSAKLVIGGKLPHSLRGADGSRLVLQ